MRVHRVDERPVEIENERTHRLVGARLRSGRQLTAAKGSRRLRHYIWSDHLTRNFGGGEPLTVIEPIRRIRLYQGIVEQIEGLLEKGDLRPGDQLPPERQLAEQFQVSRASVREALRTLELLGIVETRAGGGTFVRQTSPLDLARPLTGLMSRGHSLADVIEFRGLIY